MLGALRGAGYLLQGARLILRPGIRGYAIAPSLINAVLFAALMVLGLDWAQDAAHALLAALPGWLQWLEWLLWPLLAVGLFAAALLACLMLAGLIAAPFNGPLAAAVEARLRGGPRTPSGAGRGWFTETVRAAAGELRKAGYFLVRALPLGLLFFVPGLQLVAPPAWLLWSAWMLAVEFLDYPLANHGMGFAALRSALTARRMTALGFGAAVLALAAVPLANLLLIPAAVAGATAMAVGEGMVREG